MEINYYAYTDRTLAEKQTLADIFSGLSQEFGQMIVNLESFQQSGNFERLARIFLPETAVHIAQIDTTAKTAFWIGNPQAQLNTYADFERYLAQPDVHLIDDTHEVKRYTAGDFMRNVLAINEVSDLLILPAEPTDADRLVAPKTDNQVLREVLPEAVFPQLDIETYCISAAGTFEIVRQFEMRLQRHLKGVKLPDNAMIRTRLYQTFITAYRMPILKASASGRPMIYSATPQVLAVLKFLMNPDVVVEKVGSFERVDGPELFNRVMNEADLTNAQSQTRMPVMEDLAGTKRTTVTVDNFVSPSNHTVRSQHVFDVLTA
ncbi:hypothetical protein [uncultured Secundilactobacillus sp.]|uniref:hypothetical protein n=1 Tax=uncultured Secundilactobacillus sp. TaxID=2813935 RepID=UPI00258C24FC|nr:hypothetical protein [uncultured Secundilactobacillus sp.]